MNDNPALAAALIVFIGATAQWFSWWLKLPAILLLLVAGLAIGLETQPLEIGADRLDIVRAAALGIGIVDAQQETPAALLGEHPVVQRSANVADMEPPGGRRGEAGDMGHARADSRGARA
mgnify:CR=1 FL=1